MADKPKDFKGGGKPGGKPPEGPSPDSLAWGLVGFIIFLMIIAGVLEEQGITNFLNRAENGEEFSITAGVETGDLEIGKEVISKKTLDVRNSPGGSILGQQFKRVKGIVSEGPVSAFGEKWWRVNYVDPPSGWVSSGDISSKVGLVRILNIFGIIYDFWKPVGIFLVIILIILIIWVRLKFGTLTKLQKKKKELREKGLNYDPTKSEIDTLKKSPSLGDVEATLPIGVPSNLPVGKSPDFLKSSGAPISVKEKYEEPKNNKWENVLKLIDTHNVNDWKQAVIEADIILDEMIDKMGYKGDTMAEKLKTVEESDFITLNKAWEAHKYRNKIAHKGSDFAIDKKEVERIVKLYQQVFEEFYYI